MSVIVARSSTAGSSSTGGGNLVLVAENAVTPALPAAMGANSVVLGEAAQTSAPNSLAIGSQSLTRHEGAVVVAHGRFGSSGDAQAGKYLLRTHTVNATPTPLLLDGTGGSAHLTIPDDSTWTFRVTVTAHCTSIPVGRGGYTIEGVVYRESGASTIAFQGFPIKSVIATSNPDWDINITIDTTLGALSLEATGDVGQTIRWLAVVDTVEITN